MEHPFFVFYASIVLASITIYLIYLYYALSKPKTNTPKTTPVSVIIWCKNHYDHLQENFSKWLDQDYKHLEFVFINQNSYDSTLELLEKYASIDSRVQIVDVKNIDAFWANKKYALTLGIKKAKNPFLIFTHANTCPDSNQWVQSIINTTDSQESVVLRHTNSTSNKKWLTMFVNYANAVASMQAFSFIKLKFPSVASLNIIAYHSQLFYKTNGYINHIKFPHGEHEIFLDEVKNEASISYVDDPNSIDCQKLDWNWKTFYNSIQSKFETQSRIKKRKRILIFSLFLINLAFWVSTIFAVFYLPILWVIAFVVVRIVMQMVVLFKVYKKFKLKQKAIFFPFFEVAMMSIYSVIFIRYIVSKVFKWK